MNAVIKAIEADRAAVIQVCRRLDDSGWAADSGCPGWSVQDLISHMGCSFWLAVDPSHLPDPAGLPAERAADLYVESRRTMTPAQTLEDYESVSLRGLELLASLDGQNFEVPLGDVGTYPASLVPTAFAFEEYVHLRFDLFAPNGPLPADPPTADAARLAPTLDWIEAALPQQNSDLLGKLDGAVQISLDGLCTRILQLGDGEVTARIASDSEAFVRWITQRGSWTDLGVRTDGDDAALRIAAQLHVM